jgi:tetratricopeptide (TPR) repeat protein
MKEAFPESKTIQRQLVNYYWRMGLPSFILAVTSTILSVYCIFFVRPCIKQRYYDTFASKMRLVSEHSSTQHPAALLTLLEQSHLCLRRIIDWDNSDDATRYQSGLVENEIANWYQEEARKYSLVEDGNLEMNACLSRSKTKRHSAIEEMKACEKIRGPYRGRAIVWLSHRKFTDIPELSIAELDAIEKQIESFAIDQASGDQSWASSIEDSRWVASILPSATEVLGKTRLEKLLSFRSDVTFLDRIPLFENSLLLLSPKATAGMEQTAIRAEAAYLQDLETSKEIAGGLLREYWDAHEPHKHSPTELNAVFKCMLIVGSKKEAHGFLTDQIGQISPIDQPTFRLLAAGSLLRQVCLAAIRAESRSLANVGKTTTATNSPSDNQLESMNSLDYSPSMLREMIILSIQLNPDSSELLALATGLANCITRDDLFWSLKQRLVAESAQGDSNRSDQRGNHQSALFSNWMHTIEGLRAGNRRVGVESNFRQVIKEGPAFAILMGRIVMHLHEQSDIRAELAIQYLRHINEVFPDILQIWSNRAKIHQSLKQYKEAIECLEVISSKLPENKEVLSALVEVRKRYSSLEVRKSD